MEERSVSDRSGEKKENQISILMSFKSMNCSRFFGWFFRDNKKGVPAPIARPRLINNSLPVVFNESREKRELSNYRQARGSQARKTRQRARNGYHCCYFCKTAADFRRPGRVATKRPSRRVAFFDMVLCDERNSIVSLFRKF